MPNTFEFIVTFTADEYARLERIATKNAEREAKGYKLRGTLTGTTVAALVPQVARYGFSRLDTLDRDAAKELAIKLAGEAAGVTRRRHQPRHAAKVFADPSQAEEIKDWAAAAPFAPAQ